MFQERKRERYRDVGRKRESPKWKDVTINFSIYLYSKPRPLDFVIIWASLFIFQWITLHWKIVVLCSAHINIRIFTKKLNITQNNMCKNFLIVICSHLYQNLHHYYWEYYYNILLEIIWQNLSILLTKMYLSFWKFS